ncbi:MAG: ABC transporter ATP-binding protein [Coriobacteriaceae bacterium]|jgi:iron complex transport system ATP-binding protein|nr:ABC transporter ATP-binding protein [Coriobacteriaceae bacterium]
MSVKVDNLSFSYGAHRVLDGISFEVPEGTLVNVLGPNGTGKSTLFRCILGLNRAYKGTIVVNGKDIRSLSIRERAREMAFIPQSHKPIYDYDVIDVVLMSSGAGSGVLFSPKGSDLERAHAALERVGIGFLAERPYTRISGGEQQLVLIARALAQNASTIIMDEPTSALDYGNTVRVLSCVRQLAEDGLTIIQSTHQPDQAFLYADKTLVLHEGGILAYGEPKQTITAELISKIYGVDVEVNSLYDDKVRVCVPSVEIGKRR